ncbi:MAG: glycine cleavage system aminomethyltransferase T, partial [Gammaproteobacteria bacterium]
GRTTPADLGLGKMVSKRKPFIGSSLLQREALQQQDRLQLVGLTPVDNSATIPAAAHLTDKPWQAGVTQISLGRITAAIDSPTLGHSIALALLQNGHQRFQQKLWAVSPVADKSVEVVVVDHCFYDPEGSRVHA